MQLLEQRGPTSHPAASVILDCPTATSRVLLALGPSPLQASLVRPTQAHVFFFPQPAFLSSFFLLPLFPTFALALVVGGGRRLQQPGADRRSNPTAAQPVAVS